MEAMEFKTMQAKAVSEEGRVYIEGYAAYFGNVDSWNDIIEKGAFAEAVKDFSRVRVLKQHDYDEVVGKVLELREDDKGLYFKAVLSKAEKDLAIKLEEGIYDEMSIGFYTKKAETDFQTGVRYLKDIDLREVSIVFNAANPMATINSVERKDAPATDEQLLKELKEVTEKKKSIETELLKRAIKAALKKA